MIADTSKLYKLIQSKELFIFDFDGVIADSVEVKTEAFAELYSIYGDKIVRNVIEHHRNNGGVSRYDKFRYYHQEFLGLAITDQEVNKLSKIFTGLVVDKVIASDEIPKVEKFLEQYSVGNTIYAINSATPQNEIRDIVKKRGLNNYFSVIYGSPSSKETNLRKILTLFKVSKSKSLYFGDAESDLRAAENVGLDFVGIGKDIKQLLSKIKKKNYYMDNFEKITEISNVFQN